MLRRLFPPVCLVLLGGGLFLSAQEPDFREDLRFVDALRKRKDNKLALEYLERIAKGAPPALAKELPLELAKTRLEAATEEAETTRRVALYKQAREELEKFIEKNPGHPRLADANLDVARVLNYQGKAELSRALLGDDLKTREAGKVQARGTLEEANKRLRAAVEALDKRFESLPDPEKEPDKAKRIVLANDRNRVGEVIRETQLEVALNLYSQWETGDDAKLTDTTKALQKIQDGPLDSPATWKAAAWYARCQLVTENTPIPARTTIARILASRSPTAVDGQRLAKYFLMLIDDEKPLDEKNKVQNLIREGKAWRAQYVRARRTPEGYGVSYLLARTYVAQAGSKKAPRDKLLTDARALLREIEGSENEFSEKARLLKLSILSAQGAFDKPIAKLNSFEECFIRAENEIALMNKASEKAKNAKELKEVRDPHVKAIVAALDRGLKRPDAKDQPRLQVQKARVTLTYWQLLSGNLREAIREGEAFAIADPSSQQASLAASYALDAYSRLLAREKGAATDEEMAEDRAAMFRLGGYMIERWSKDQAGDMARHEMGLALFRAENYAEAVKMLSTITPSYANVARARMHLSFACFRAVREKLEPIAGDRDGDYRRRAMAALASVPMSALGPDPETNFMVLNGKATLIGEWYRLKHFKDMESLADAVLKVLANPKIELGNTKADDKTKRQDIQNQVVLLMLYARYGQADSAFTEGNHERVIELLGPLVMVLTKEGDSPEKTALKSNRELGIPLISLAMKSYLQMGKIDETNAALEALDAVAEEGGGNNVLRVLAFLMKGQVEGLRKKGDKAELDRAIKGYTAILDKRIAKQKKMTPDFQLVVADCYSSMGEHGKAARELEKIVLPKDLPPDDKLRKLVPFKLVRELRLSKDPKNLAKATVVMEKIMAGWGKTSLQVILENGLLLEAREKYAEGFRLYAPLVKRLVGKLDDPRMKDAYLECYFHMVFCYYKNGQTLSTKAERDKALANAARMTSDLEKAQGVDFGSNESKKRFDEMFAAEPALYAEYRAARKKKSG